MLRRSAVSISIASPSAELHSRPAACYRDLPEHGKKDTYMLEINDLDKSCGDVTCFLRPMTRRNWEHATSYAAECAHDPLPRNTHAQLLCVISN